MEDQINEANINILNDDCLVNIFKYLPIEDQFKIDLICKRWKVLSELIWRNHKILKIDFDFVDKYIQLCQNLRNNTIFVLNLIRRCGAFIDKVYINADQVEVLDYKLLLLKLSDYCKNITELTLVDRFKINYGFSDENLGKIFAFNVNLCSVSLKNLSINGDCLLSLCNNPITKLSFCGCDIVSTDYLYDSLSQIKNLQIFEIKCHSFINDIAIFALMNCDTISEITFNEVNNLEYLSAMLSCQRKLSKLEIKETFVDGIFMENLPTDFLEEISLLEYSEEMSFSLHRFKNLKSITCTVGQLTDQCIKGLADCESLLNIDIIVTNYSLTSTGESYFNQFKNLKSFKIKGPSSPKTNIDSILVNLEQCKNLKNLKFERFLLTGIGASCISSFPELSCLDVSNTNITDEHLISLVKKLTKLEEIKVKGCKNVTNFFVETASEILYNRQDNHNLKVFHYDSCIDADNITYYLSVISLIEE